MNIEVVPHGPAFRCGNTSERCKPSHEKIAPWNGNQGLFQTSLEKDIKVPRTYRYETNIVGGAIINVAALKVLRASSVGNFLRSPHGIAISLLPDHRHAPMPAVEFSWHERRGDRVDPPQKVTFSCVGPKS